MKAIVESGRLRLDEPSSLPDGTVLELVVDDEGDDLDATERRALHEAISRAWTAAKTGQVRPAREVVETLRRR